MPVCPGSGYKICSKRQKWGVRSPRKHTRKLWFYLSNKNQQERLKQDPKISKFKNSPLLAEYARSYDAFAAVSERAQSTP